MPPGLTNGRECGKTEGGFRHGDDQSVKEAQIHQHQGAEIGIQGRHLIATARAFFRQQA